MEDHGEEFPGFQTCVHREELEYRRPLSRLQRRAPCQLQIKANNKAPLECKTSAATSSFNSFYHSKDPIPLLSPLVLPSLLESSYIQQGNPPKPR
ncbi:hypothetical protein NC653_025458 [Populus alba x Populus x berolinensis]|uniref:Uncharacterized protein n=1 Tax=Populus alba x Populus x berolinensis TaxID=444605 RepID=A0AAD6MBB9_9ROSI|nr:hypothetical protein NC653_025458 [Populus alba x Populus x berolinensis]